MTRTPDNQFAGPIITTTIPFTKKSKEAENTFAKNFFKVKSNIF
jgi:hypothetical protein